MLRFPKRVYTIDEFKAAREALERGHKHRLKVTGSRTFKRKIKQILSLIEKAGYFEFLCTYIREVKEIDGLGQLREADATIWLSSLNTTNPVEAARFIIQKAFQMKAYLDGKLWYNTGELHAIHESIEFLLTLRKNLAEDNTQKMCDEAIQLWTEDRVT